MDWTSFLRQLYLCSGLWALDFTLGLCLGLPTVLVPQLRRENQIISDDEASWLVTIYAYSGIPWVFIQAVLIAAFGRKKTHIVSCSCVLIGFVIFYFSTNMKQFYIGQIFLAALAAAIYTTSMTVMTECTSAKYRGVFLTIKSATCLWGMLVSNTIGTFFHWQNIVIFGLVCVVYILINVIVWPESPLWLASKGKFEECSTAHKWLKGNDEASERELGELLKSQEHTRLVKRQSSLRYILFLLRRKHYLKPVILSHLLMFLNLFSGKIIFAIYAIDVFKNISNNESTAYSGMLILDGVTVASMYLGCIVSKFLRRRVILIGLSTTGIIVMLIISIYLYLASLSVLEENKYFTIFLLATYSIAVSCGPVTISVTMMGELLPLESRMISLCMMALSFKFIYGSIAKVSLLCFKSLGMHGTFLLYAILSSICLVMIYFYVPETKDKTIHEINDSLRGNEKRMPEENNELMNVNFNK